MGQLYFTGNIDDIDMSGVSANIFTRYGAGEQFTTATAAGLSHIIVILTDGTLWGIGSNAEGQLGLGATNHFAAWTLISADTDWTYVTCGYQNSFAIKSDGTLWGCGYGGYGALGIGDTTGRTVFSRIGLATNWLTIKCSYSHTLALQTDGTLWVTGYNVAGELGLNDGTRRLSFEQMGGATNWRHIALGHRSSMIINANNELFGAGYDGNYQLSTGTYTAKLVFTQEQSMATDWKHVDVSCYCSCAVKNDGKVYFAGTEVDDCAGGQGGDTEAGGYIEITMPTPMEYVVTTGQTCYYVSTTGLLWVAGDNQNDQLGVAGSIIHVLTAVPEFLATAVLIVPQCDYFGANPSVSLFVLLETTYGQHKSVCGGIRFNNKEIIGSRLDGTLYQLDPTVYKDGTDNIQRIRRSQILSNDNAYLLHHKIQVEFEPGVGIEGEDAPTVTLKWSDDGGNTWSEGRELSIGEYEDYAKRVIWRRLGKSRNRIYELSCTDPVKMLIIDAYADITLT